MPINAKVIQHSRAPNGKELTTLSLLYPRFIHAELMTHRVFSRNASSSRAIPVQKVIDMVRVDPAMPVHWGKNQPGMQAREELDEDSKIRVWQLWEYAAYQATEVAEKMMKLGAHKQVINRILEPFQHIAVVLTTTEWDNWDELRDHPDADPTIHALAVEVKQQRAKSTPVERPRIINHESSWHLPYVTDEERLIYQHIPNYLAKLSVARCARVSYLTHDGRTPNEEADIALYDRLVGSRPLHASPTEHQGYPLPLANQRSNNFQGWRQFRETVEFAFQ